jgi:hypothetical protein
MARSPVAIGGAGRHRSLVVADTLRAPLCRARQTPPLTAASVEEQKSQAVLLHVVRSSNEIRHDDGYCSRRGSTRRVLLSRNAAIRLWRW